jgi:uncharacterized Zn finger protein
MQTKYPSLQEEYAAIEEALKSKIGMEKFVRKYTSYKTLKQDAYTIIIRESGQKILICRECGSNNHEILSVSDYHDCKNLIVEVREDDEYFDCPKCGGPPTIDVLKKDVIHAASDPAGNGVSTYTTIEVVCKKCGTILKKSWRPFTVTQCGCAGPEHGKRK